MSGGGETIPPTSSGGGGGSGTVTALTSTNGSVTITNPTGPTVNLSVGTGAGVASFNTRSGVVTLASGDLTALMTLLAAANTSMVVGGSTLAPTVKTGTLDVIATQGPANAAVPLNSQKITGLANGSGAQDAAAFGQIPTSAGTIGGVLAANNGSDFASASTTLFTLGGFPITEVVNVVGTGGAAQTIPTPATSGKTASVITLSANLTITMPTAAAGVGLSVYLIQPASGGPYTVTWPGTVLNAPVVSIGANSQTGVFLFCADGTHWVASSIGGLFFPEQAPTASAPAYVKGAMYFDTTLNKLRIGGASGWETVTSS